MTNRSTRSLLLKPATSEKERQQVIKMLQAQKLPVTDIHEHTILYGLMDGEKLVGTAGLEIFGDCALLRSISLVAGIQGKGYGSILNRQVEQFAKDRGISCVYLVTTTARDFFERQDYTVIERGSAPDIIKQTEQFSALCPSSAVVMKKHL